MKLLAAEIVVATSPIGISMIRKLIEAPSAAILRDRLRDFEQGGIWTQLGIRNFLEGDLFAWYLDAWNEGCANAIRAMARTLDQFDPTTLNVDPVESRDLLKQLYSSFFPNRSATTLASITRPTGWRSSSSTNLAMTAIRKRDCLTRLRLGHLPGHGLESR
jgi:hypothetical protein